MSLLALLALSPPCLLGVLLENSLGLSRVGGKAGSPPVHTTELPLHITHLPAVDSPAGRTPKGKMFPGAGLESLMVLRWHMP